ncbi:MAG: TIGR04053 family radical SAM/SPASM domain-containing protein [Planctomycetia bacterium]|nr:TIGR04053 family radical SAM/SPASM domain-containing protein [Planctomycetia bacterium]
MHGTPYTKEDFGRNPLMFYYEITRACDLVCKHCRASAQSTPAPDELSPEQSRKLIDQVATFPRKPTLCFTGGDPLKRADLFDLIKLAHSHGIQTALTPSATPLATREKFLLAKEAGVNAIGLSLDGPDADLHDSFRGFEGSFEQTRNMLAWSRELCLPVQVNTSLTASNVDRLDEIATLLAHEGIAIWSVFFLVPVGRGRDEHRITKEQYLHVFEKLFNLSREMPYAIKTTEAPHYRRYVLEHGGDPLAVPQKVTREMSAEAVHRAGEHRAPLGITDGRGIMFTGHNGEIYPAGFLPLSCGQFPRDSVVEVYQNHPLFRKLRTPSQFGGICGTCSWNDVCGGSRARAFATCGDPLGPEPDCPFF